MENTTIKPIYMYIKYGIGIIEYDFQLDPEMYYVGYNYEDYLNNAWVKLSQEHIAFKEQYPNCSPYELFNLTPNLIYKPSEQELLTQTKANKINKLMQYDTSKEVNSFYLDNVQVWLDKATRVGLMNSLQIEKSSGRTKSTVWFNDVCYTLPIDLGIQMLQALELYALDCYNNTISHKVAIQNLETIEQINDYDFTKGYPQKLNFDSKSF